MISCFRDRLSLFETLVGSPMLRAFYLMYVDVGEGFDAISFSK
jgi:hypothetical protein